jgi:two-component system response regulator
MDRPILLVEDNADDEELTLRALARSHVGNRVVVARDGAEALGYLLGTPEAPALGPLPALVLLDLKLPKIDGLEVLQRLRAAPRTRRLPVVILTSSGEERDLIEAYDRGANSYVRKPVDFVQFVEAVKQLGLFWLVVNQPPPMVSNETP